MLERWLLAVLLLVAAAWVPAVDARERGNGLDATIASEIRAGELPREARDTIALIRRGGPFPYAKDGTVFGNREGRLPRMRRGHYTEYTVRTPGSADRGARRIVAGGDPRATAELYYTADHYQSFRRIRE